LVSLAHAPNAAATAISAHATRTLGARIGRRA
jgi:hypothetical protein